jgi:transcriptional regulator GlxA family with amidase domain
LTGKSATRFIRNIRLEKARTLLETTNMTVSEVAYETGFGSAAYFSRVFQEEFGVPPSGIKK